MYNNKTVLCLCIRTMTVKNLLKYSQPFQDLNVYGMKASVNFNII